MRPPTARTFDEDNAYRKKGHVLPVGLERIQFLAERSYERQNPWQCKGPRRSTIRLDQEEQRHKQETQKRPNGALDSLHHGAGCKRLKDN